MNAGLNARSGAGAATSSKRWTQSDEQYAFEKHGEDTFFRAFAEDLEAAKDHLIIQSPFIAMRRLEQWQPILRRLVARGVGICAFLKTPDNWHERDSPATSPEVVAKLQQADELLHALRNLGVHINLRAKIHAKLAVIDDTILWEGSLNQLSHRDTTEETTRWIHRKVLVDVSSRHKLYACSECWSKQSGVPVTDATCSKKLRELSKLLSDRRKALKLSQSDLARLSGVHRSSICRFERNSLDIPSHALVKIATAIGLDLIPAPTILRHAVENFMTQTAREFPSKRP